MFAIKSVFAVLVLYETRLEDSSTLMSLNRSLEDAESELDMLVYNNSPRPQDYPNYFKYNRLNILYCHNPLNGGLGVAYNFGADLIKERSDKKWLLLLDQDTTFSTDFFHKTQIAVETYPCVTLFAPKLFDEIGIFSPAKYKYKSGHRLSDVAPGIYHLKKIVPVNSGLLISKTAFFEAGKYNEKVKLDFSDLQFIERLKKIHPSFCLTGAIGHQNFSNNETDVLKLNLRYSFFCQGARNIERNSPLDSLIYFLLAFKRGISLARRTKKTIFFKTFFIYYCRNRRNSE